MRVCVCVCEDDSHGSGCPPVAPAGDLSVIAIVRRAISLRLMNIVPTITYEKVNSRTSAAINYSLSGRGPVTLQPPARPSHQEERQREAQSDLS